MEKRLFYLLPVLVILLSVVWSCKDDNNTPTTPDPSPGITISDSENLTPVFSQQGGTASIAFTTTADWTTNLVNTRAESWITVNPSSGKTGKNEITITATANETHDERNATIALKCGSDTKSIVVTQKQKDALTVTSSKYEVDSKGGNISVEVKANISFEVEIKADWIKQQTETARALTTSNLNFAIDLNETGEKREGEIVIRSGNLSETIKIYQGFEHFITLTQKDFTLPEEGGEVNIEIKSTLDYAVKKLPDTDWITESQARAVSTHTHHYTISANETYDSREAKIVFYDPKNENIADTVSIFQTYKGAILIARNEYEIEGEGGQLDFTIQSNLDFEVTTSAEWIQILSNGSRGLTDYPLSFIIQPNESEKEREGTITIQERNGTRSQKIQVLQGIVDYEAIERAALIAFYEATGGDNWKLNTNWCTDAPLDEWEGVYLYNGRVSNLCVPFNNLKGHIPSDIGKLSKLSQLDLHNNQLSGTIPEELYELTELYRLQLDDNELTGQISDKIGQIDIYWLELQNNKFSGPLPSTLSQCKNLHYTHLENNLFEGNIPLDLWNSKMTELHLNNNRLTGNIPPEICNMKSINFLFLQNNQLSGNLPKEIANLTFLRELDVSNNCLSGMVPDEIVNSHNWGNWDIYEKILPQKEGYGLNFANAPYASSDYSRHKELTLLQTHTKGNGVKIVIMGDGYTDKLIADGTYEKISREAMEAFFELEPYATFREYFDVYQMVIVSPNEYIENHTGLKMQIIDGVGDSQFMLYDKSISLIKSYLNERKEFNPSMTQLIFNETMAEVTVLVHLRNKNFYRSGSSLTSSNHNFWGNGLGIAFCITNNDDFNYLVQHEGGGHAFAKLGDEYVAYQKENTDPYYYNKWHKNGWYFNIDSNNNPLEISWKDFINNENYATEKIGIYEGAGGYAWGIYRSTETSIMRDHTLKFNAPSRCSIYRRIMELAGEKYSLEKFFEYDKINYGQNEKTTPRSSSKNSDISKLTVPPIVRH